MPTDAGRAATDFQTGGVGNDPWVCNLPAGIAAGDLLLLYVRGHGGATFATSLTGWTYLVTNNTADASDDPSCIMYRWADGTEGLTVTLDVTAVMKGASITYRITDAANPAVQAPEIVGPTVAGIVANVDCPAITPTGGSKDYLFIALAGMDGETQNYTAPANYLNMLQSNSGTSGSPGANVRLAGASRELTAASEDPGVYTVAAPVSGSSGWTMAIHPPVLGGASVLALDGEAEWWWG